MRGACAYYTGTNRHLLKNYYSKINLLRSVTHWRRSGVFIVNLEHISHLVLVFLLLTEKVKVDWVRKCLSISISPPIFSEIFHRRDINYNL